MSMTVHQYLLVPDGQEVPDGLASDVIVLQKPLNRIYLAASSAMALFRALDSLDCIKMTGIDASGWYIQEAKDAIEEGAMQFAGKYSEPDYEMLVDEDCDVAIESTMILHTPKVQEMIENLGFRYLSTVPATRCIRLAVPSGSSSMVQ